MGIREVVKDAALAAVRFALPTIPEELVRWQDEPQCQGEADMPNVVLSEVSLVPEGPVSRIHRPNDAGDLVQTLVQGYLYTVQFAFESWLTSTGHVLPVIMRSRMGWYTAESRELLADLKTPASRRTPLKMLYQVGQVVPMRTTARGHTLPRYYYEIRFRTYDYALEPQTIGRLESAAFTGTLNDGDEAISVAIDSDS